MLNISYFRNDTDHGEIRWGKRWGGGGRGSKSGPTEGRSVVNIKTKVVLVFRLNRASMGIVGCEDGGGVVLCVKITMMMGKTRDTTKSKKVCAHGMGESKKKNLFK